MDLDALRQAKESLELLLEHLAAKAEEEDRGECRDLKRAYSILLKVYHSYFPD